MCMGCLEQMFQEVISIELFNYYYCCEIYFQKEIRVTPLKLLDSQFGEVDKISQLTVLFIKQTPPTLTQTEPSVGKFRFHSTHVARKFITWYFHVIEHQCRHRASPPKVILYHKLFKLKRDFV